MIKVVPPPTLPGLKTNFKGLLNVLQCELMLYLMKLVLDRADDLQSKCFSEDQVYWPRGQNRKEPSAPF